MKVIKMIAQILFAIVLVATTIGLASAVNDPSLELTKIQEITIHQDGKIRVANTGDVYLTDVTLSGFGDFDVTFSSNHFNLAPGESRVIDVSLVDIEDLIFGTNNLTVEANSVEGASDSVFFVIEKTFCVAGPQGASLEIRDIDINNYEQGDDEEWILLDEIEVEVTVDNRGGDINDVVVELGLFNANGANMVNDLEFLNEDDEKIELGRMNEGEREDANFRFKVHADMDVGNYKLVVKTYSEDLGEENECTDSLNGETFQPVSIDLQDDEGKFIKFENIRVDPEEAMCEDWVRLDTLVYNIGDGGRQDRVLIRLENDGLDLLKEAEILNGLDEREGRYIEFDFQIPENAEERVYQLRLTAFYEYERGEYERQSDDTLVPLIVAGCPGGEEQTLEERVAELEKQVQALEERTAKTESVLENFRQKFNSFVKEVREFMSRL